MMDIVDGDLLAVKTGLIAHQVNCQGVMGAGVALAIAKAFPEVEGKYVEACRRLHPSQLLGNAQVCPVGDLIVVNVFGQLSPGRGVQTDYPAVAHAIDQLAFHPIYPGLGARVLHVPYLMGCGLAGGDWDTYSLILETAWPSPVVAHRLVTS